MTDVRDMAMGQASVACAPLYGNSKNISFIIPENKTQVICTASNKYLIKDLSPVFVAVSKSFNNNFAIITGIGRIGNNSFSENFIEAGIAKKLGQTFYAGIKIQYHQWILNDSYYQNSHAFIPSIGLFSNPLKNLFFGVVIRNPVRSRMNAIEKNKLPAEINPGISVKVSDKVLVALSVTQQSNLSLSTQFGLEYLFHPKLFFRVGCHTVPASESFGFGLKMKKINLDIALETHPILGNSSAIALIFLL